MNKKHSKIVLMEPWEKEFIFPSLYQIFQRLIAKTIHQIYKERLQAYGIQKINICNFQAGVGANRFRWSIKSGLLSIATYHFSK